MSCISSDPGNFGESENVNRVFCGLIVLWMCWVLMSCISSDTCNFREFEDVNCVVCG